MKRSWPVAALVLAACSHPSPQPAPEAADSEITAPPVVEAPPAIRPLVGTWRISTDIAGGRTPRRNAPPGRQGTMQLLAGVSASPDGFAAIQRQYVATANIPGYAVPPAPGRGRGRRTTVAATPTTWWPAPGDSVIVHIVGVRGNRIQLRGRLSGATIRGEVWLMSLETGNSFQLGTFTATKATVRR